MCKCPKDKKYLLSWANTEYLKSLRKEMQLALQGKGDFITEKITN
jgi:hypothetical protein